MGRPWKMSGLTALAMLCGCASAPVTKPSPPDAQVRRVTVQCTLTGTTDAPCIQEARHECAGDAKLKEIVSHTAMPVTEGVDQHVDSLARYVAIYSCST
jgi:hypothetical protein